MQQLTNYYGPVYVTWDDAPEWCNNACRADEADAIIVEYEYQEIPTCTFDMMKQLAEWFGTEHVDLGHERRNIGGCETCDYSYDVLALRISKITRWPEGFKEL